MSFYAAIFDLDGTVVADEEAYGEAFGKVLSRLGVSDIPDYPHKGGIGVVENWPYLIQKYNIKKHESISELARETQENLLANIDSIGLKEGFPGFLDRIRKESIASALATSNEWFVVEELMVSLSLSQYFDCIVTADEVLSKKPDPGIFLLAAQKLVVDPSDCVVFEDSRAGIEAAKRARMRSVGIARDTSHAETLVGADYVVYDYQEMESVLPKLLAGDTEY